MNAGSNSGSSDHRTPPHIGTLILLSGLSALAMNVFLPSLPRMAEYFETEYSVLQLSVSLYLGVNAITQILVGPISDKIGRRPVILWGLVLFALATLGCIFAQSAWVFLIFRMAQSTVVVAMVISRASVRDRYDASQAASMIGYVTMGMAVVPMIGPAIGGILDEWLGWTANFWLLFIAAIMAFALAYVDFGETKMKSGLTLGQQFKEYPELLRSPRFWGYALASGLTSGSFFSYLGGAPFVGTEIFGLTPSQLGFYFGAPAIGYVIGNFLSGRYSMRFGINRMVLWGCLVCLAGVLPNVLIMAAGYGTAVTFFGLMVMIGIGNGLAIPNATSGALSVRPHLAATASGLSGAIMLGLGAVLSALAGTLLTPETGAEPLLWLMVTTSAMSVVAIILVIFRERQLGL